ncbi:hypothetical protein, partial [Streptomyces sp. NPDC057676]
PAEGAPAGAPQPPPGGYGVPALPLPAEGQPFPAAPQGYGYPPAQGQGYGYPQAPAPGYGYPQADQPAGYPQQGYGYPGQPDQPQAPRPSPYDQAPLPGQPQPGQPGPGQPLPGGPYAGQPDHAGQSGQSGQPGSYGGQQGAFGQLPGQPGQPASYAGEPERSAAYPGQPGRPAAYQPEAQPQTQILRAQPAAPPAGQAHTQILRPQPPAPAADQGHTQILRPRSAAPGAGASAGARQPQPELRQPPESPAESTTMLRRPVFGDSPTRPGAADETQVLPGPIPAAGPPPHPGGAPYGVRPGAPGDRQPPAEFDGLFRTEGAGEASDSTQQMPLFDQGPGPQPPRQGAYPPHGSYDHGPDHGGPGGYDGQGGGPGGDGGRRRSRRGVVIGAVVAACAVAGLAAGAAMSMGDDDKKDKGDKKVESDKEVVASESAAPSASPAPTPAADPAEPQVKALDALLKDSGNSRATVIASVNNIRSCKALPKAATDLRAAAQQRNALVTRLSELSVDKIPQHAELTQALTKAWRSSASADNHYAAWADQAGKKKGCDKGRARSTGHTLNGNRASDAASAAKEQAAKLWNPLAVKYKLTERKAAQL